MVLMVSLRRHAPRLASPGGGARPSGTTGTPNDTTTAALEEEKQAYRARAYAFKLAESVRCEKEKNDVREARSRIEIQKKKRHSHHEPPLLSTKVIDWLPSLAPLPVCHSLHTFPIKN